MRRSWILAGALAATLGGEASLPNETEAQTPARNWWYEHGYFCEISLTQDSPATTNDVPYIYATRTSEPACMGRFLGWDMICGDHTTTRGHASCAAPEFLHSKDSLHLLFEAMHRAQLARQKVGVRTSACGATGSGTSGDGKCLIGYRFGLPVFDDWSASDVLQ